MACILAYVATVYRRGKTWTAQWYRGKERIARSTGLTGKREAQKRADEMEVEDRKALKQEPVSQGQLHRILIRAAEDAKAGNLTTRKAEEYLLAIRRVGDDSFRLVTVKSQLESWVGSQSKRVGPSTAKGYGEMQKAALDALGRKAGIPISDLTHDDCEKLIHDLKTPKRTAATANQHFRAFRRALQAAVRTKLIADNPADGVRPLLEDDSTERAPFTPEEATRMLVHPETGDEWQGMILFGGNTGLRMSDITKLTGKLIEDKALTLRPAKTHRKGKGNIVRIPLSKPLLRWLDGREGPLFPALSKLSPQMLSYYFKRIMLKAEVPDKITVAGKENSRSFHSLRHSFTTWLAQADIHPDVRKKLTGHSTEEAHAIYTHHDEALDDAISKLPAIHYQRGNV